MAIIFTLLSILCVLLIIILIWKFSSKQRPCPSFLSWLIALENPFAKENQSARIIEHLEIKEGMYLADVGCGPGRVTLPLAQAVGLTGRIVAIDMQDAMLEKLRKKAADLKNVEIRNARIGEGTLEEGRYDAILLVNVLGEMPDQEAALQELFKALKSDGLLSITETLFDPHFQRQKHVEEVARPIGFVKGPFFGRWYSYTLHLIAKK